MLSDKGFDWQDLLTKSYAGFERLASRVDRS